RARPSNRFQCLGWKAMRFLLLTRRSATGAGFIAHSAQLVNTLTWPTADSYPDVVLGTLLVRGSEILVSESSEPRELPARAVRVIPSGCSRRRARPRRLAGSPGSAGTRCSGLR